MSTIAEPSQQTVPAPYLALVDDAAIFPPGDAPLPAAVAAHREHRVASYAGMVGAFVVSDVRLPDLIQVLRAEQTTDPDGRALLGISVVVTGGAGAIEPAVRWATRADELDLRTVEIALRDESDLVHNARRMTTALDQLTAAGELAEDTAFYVEPPRLHDSPPPRSWLAAVDEIAAADLRLKFRTGGVAADAFPSANELATCVEVALDRELPFKCTAGLHRALRRRDQETGFEHHGFLNVLLATRASLDGIPAAGVARLLEETDRATVLGGLASAGETGLVSARRWFTSFGSCSVREPLEDLVALDLMPDLRLETR